MPAKKTVKPAAKKAPVVVKKPAPKTLEIKPAAVKPNSGKPKREWSATRDEKFAKPAVEGDES